MVGMICTHKQPHMRHLNELVVQLSLQHDHSKTYTSTNVNTQRFEPLVQHATHLHSLSYSWVQLNYRVCENKMQSMQTFPFNQVPYLHHLTPLATHSTTLRAKDPRLFTVEACR